MPLVDESQLGLVVARPAPATGSSVPPSTGSTTGQQPKPKPMRPGPVDESGSDGTTSGVIPVPVHAINSTEQTEAAYNYTFDLGPYGSQESLCAFTIADASHVFYPLVGFRDDFKVGDRFFLGLYTSKVPEFPIRVIAITRTSFTFEAIYYHPEGAGRTITFAFLTRQHEQQLKVFTSAKGFYPTTGAPGLSWLNFKLAKSTWSQVAQNIRLNYYYNEVTTGPGGPLPPPPIVA